MTRTILAFILCCIPYAATHASSGLTVVTLAPHLTEWVYSLEQQDQLLAVSDYSDYPPAARLLPRVADYQGADIKAIIKLQPDIVLAWQGGNRAQDLSRLEQLGFTVFRSQPQQPEDIAKELMQLAALLQVSPQVVDKISQYAKGISQLRQDYSEQKSPLAVFYYTSSSPLMTVGANTWANRLLNVCGAHTLFADAPNDYPQVSVKTVLRRQPQVLVAATVGQDSASVEPFWQPHRAYLSAPLLRVNADIMSRFTLRLLPALRDLCAQLHTATSSSPTQR